MGWCVLYEFREGSINKGSGNQNKVSWRRRNFSCIIEKKVCDLVEKVSLDDVRVAIARNKFEARMGNDYPTNDFSFPFIHSLICCLGDTIVSKAWSISLYNLMEINKDQMKKVKAIYPELARARE